MREMDARQIARAIAFGSAELGDSRKDRLIEALTTLVIDLLVEVEALRRCQLKEAAYVDAYRDVAEMSHDSSGVMMSIEKVIACFYPDDVAPNRRIWREPLMMQRLGMAPEAIEAFIRHALEVSELKT
jgi:hypothetical protein